MKRYVYDGFFEVHRALNTEGFIVGVFHLYPFVWQVGMHKQFYSSDFQLLSEKNAELWKLQGDIMGSAM